MPRKSTKGRRKKERGKRGTDRTEEEIEESKKQEDKDTKTETKEKDTTKAESEKKVTTEKSTDKKKPVAEKIIPEETKSYRREEFDQESFPEVGELVIGTCTKITSHGAYLQLMGYEHLGKETGFVHISELSRTWVRNIRAHIKEGQRTVARVLRVNPARLEIDLTVRRVSESQKRLRLQAYKSEQRALAILNSVGKEKKWTPEIIRDKVTIPLRENYESVYTGLMSLRDNGIEVLTEMGIEKEISQRIYEVAKKELEPPSVTLIGIASLSVYEPNGVEVIQSIFKEAKEKALGEGEKKQLFEIRSISSPEYRVIITGDKWKSVERTWKIFQNEIESSLKKVEGEASFSRD